MDDAGVMATPKTGEVGVSANLKMRDGGVMGVSYYPPMEDHIPAPLAWVVKVQGDVQTHFRGV